MKDELIGIIGGSGFGDELEEYLSDFKHHKMETPFGNPSSDILTGKMGERKIAFILRKNGVVKAGIFGSYARGEAKKNSDIDILIKFKGSKSLFDLSGLKI